MVHNLEIVGDGTTKTLSTLMAAAVAAGKTGLANWASMRPIWLQYVVGSGTWRIGDSDTDATHGLPLASGSGQLLPPIAIEPNGYIYEFTTLYINGTNGGALSLMFEA